MALQAKTLELIQAARDVLQQQGPPMTLRQLYYQLVSRQVLENRPAKYKALSNAIVAARQQGLIRWDWIEDRLRVPREVEMWDGVSDFADTVRAAYRRDVWAAQPAYVECWLEKDALSGIFETVLRPYGVTLNVGRGYDGWSSIRNAAQRFRGRGDVHVIYFGDFDPSGEDMVRSLRERLSFFNCHPDIEKCALTADDVARYDLPPDPTKETDKRRERFIAEHGDNCVELDALPPAVLRTRIVAEIERRIDVGELQAVKAQEEADKTRIHEALERLK